MDFLFSAESWAALLTLTVLIVLGIDNIVVAEGFHQHIPKGYIYFAMGFSVFAEMLNLRAKRATR